MDRREFIATAVGAAALPATLGVALELPAASAKHLPRYRGFNLQWERRPGTSAPAFEESD
jgi:hypothetical protein